MGQTIALFAIDGHQLSAYRAEPGGPPAGLVVVAQEIFGINAHMRGVCDRFAAAGYRAIAPALFDRVERKVELDYSAEGVERGRAIRGQISFEDALLDLAAAKRTADELPVAVVGYCWGGTLAWLSASRLDGLAAAVGYYAGGIGNFVGEQPRCPVMMHFGEQDHAIPLSDVEALGKAHPELPIHLYPAGHGFNCEARGSYQPEAAALAQQRTLEFLARHLVAPTGNGSATG